MNEYGLTTVKCTNCRRTHNQEEPLRYTKFFTEENNKHYCARCEEEIIDWIRRAEE